jgi:hypothetical protein
VNTDHFLYWGRTRRTVDGKVVEFNIIEQTEFLDDVTYAPFNARYKTYLVGILGRVFLVVLGRDCFRSLSSHYSHFFQIRIVVRELA